MEFGVAWDTADVLMAAMALINIPAIFILKEPVVACMKDYIEQKRQNKDPVFKVESIDLKDEVDFWK